MSEGFTYRKNSKNFYGTLIFLFLNEMTEDCLRSIGQLPVDEIKTTTTKVESKG